MALIEGICDDVITLLFLFFTIVILIISWLSTNVRELPPPTNFYFVERNTGRLYTANSFDGNINIYSSTNVFSTSGRSSSRVREEALATASSSGARAWSTTLSTNANTSMSSSISSTNRPDEGRMRPDSANRISRINLNSSNSGIEIVDELVEQALVDNLLDGNIYSTSHHGIQNQSFADNFSTASVVASSNLSSITSENTVVNSSQSGSGNAAGGGSITADGVSSGNGRAIASMTTSSETNDSAHNLNSPACRSHQTLSEDFINLFIRFVNEKEIKVRVKPNDTILILKKTYFSNEISNNKIVRFIYQGQFLNDKATIKSYNIKDQTTIHCHITSKPASVATIEQQSINRDTSSSSSSSTADASRPITNENITNATSSSSIGQHLTNATTNTNVLRHRNANETSADLNPTSPDTNGAVDASIGNNNQPLEPIEPLSIHLNHLLLPFFAFLLGTCWYFRINFKHFFSPLSTLILIIFTFLYALFLFNNIHSTSSYAVNNFLLHNRLLHRRVTTSSTANPPSSTTTAASSTSVS